MKPGPKLLGLDTKSFTVASCLSVGVARSAKEIVQVASGLELRKTQRLLWELKKFGCVADGARRGTWLLTKKGEILMSRSVQRYEGKLSGRAVRSKLAPDASRIALVKCERCHGTGKVPAPRLTVLGAST